MSYIMVPYYDAILALIPLTLVGITAVLVAFGLTTTVALPAAALVAMGLMGHAMFVNSPTGTTEPVPERSRMEFDSAGGD